MGRREGTSNVAQKTIQHFTQSRACGGEVGGPVAGLVTGRMASPAALIFVALFVVLMGPSDAAADDAKTSSGSFSQENPSLLQLLYPESGESNRRKILDRVAPRDSVLPRAVEPAVEPLESFIVGGDPALRAQLDHPVLPSFSELESGGSGLKRQPSALPSFYDAMSLAENPGFEKTEAGAVDPNAETEIAAHAEPVFDVNKADQDELMETLELDARRARYIVEFRTIFGAFGSPEDLVQVAGINDTDVIAWEKQGLLNFD